jgi:hypothetical protein
MSEILWNNPKIQSNSPSQQRDYSVDVAKYEENYQNNSNVQELIDKQSTKYWEKRDDLQKIKLEF